MLVVLRTISIQRTQPKKTERLLCVPRNQILPRPDEYRIITINPSQPDILTPFKTLAPLRPNAQVHLHRDGNPSRNITYLLLCELNK